MPGMGRRKNVVKRIIINHGHNLKEQNDDIRARAQRARDAGYKAGMTRILYEGHNRCVGPALWIDTPAKEGDVWKKF